MSPASSRPAGPSTSGIAARSPPNSRICHVASVGDELAHVHCHAPSPKGNLLAEMVSGSSLLHRPRPLAPQHRSLLVYTYATPTSLGVYVNTQPPQTIYQPFTDEQPIAVAEIAAALFALIWIGRRCYQPTAVTLATDSTVVYYTLSTGKGFTFRHTPMLQMLYVCWFQIKIDRSHGLVLRWVPSNANLADPVSRGVLP
jgi:ribonuclease HI